MDNKTAHLEKTLAARTGLKTVHVRNILKLLEEGATIPFIARYRKEMTGSASDEQLREFDEVCRYSRKLLDRKEEILRLIAERGRLTAEVETSVRGAETLAEVEDIYRPYREKKSTRAGQATARGLAPLADALERGDLSLPELARLAERYVRGEVGSADDAINGARDILAERFSDDPREREIVRNQIRRNGRLLVKPGKGFNESGGYANYSRHSERIAHIPSHRYLAICRGVREKQLSMKIDWDIERVLSNIWSHRIQRKRGSAREVLFEAYKDGLKRLLIPSIEREVHAELKERSDRRAIGVFGKNLTQLLMTPPVTGRVILGVDPAFRTGCKLAVIDENGDYLDHAVIYPTPPRSEFDASREKVLDLVGRYGINGVAIGNGTGSRETQEFFARLNLELDKPLDYTVVFEAGASVYSASRLGQEEYPDLDVTIRGAISIAQRLRDPMAALVKIEPKALGIGQYQHDVDQKMLERKLHDTVEDLVNRVGVEVNSASASLLAYVAGVGPRLARAIVEHRNRSGSFSGKKELLKVKGLGAKAFEQCAGFLRIRNGVSVLDNTGVHPESYPAAKKLLKNGGVGTVDTDGLERMAADLGLGIETLMDIIRELNKPGFDPRTELPAIPFRNDVTDINQLRVGSEVSGVVRSIVDFGAFVDIGLKNDGLVHISKMSESRISHPLEVVSVNQYLPRLKVVSIDVEKNRIGLSMV
ncbi:MAG: RNA-binding transcriptional accessory protein [Deltaproteobacteria bacterium]|nr:RNA-binding transcriptional accessory protein [Deltaproteobacteria bacterium]